MSTNKVTYGLRSTYIAFQGSGGSYETPIAIPGAVNFTPTPEGNKTTFYADDMKYYVVSSNNGYNADIEWANIPDTVLKEMLGWEIDSNGMLVEVADAQPKKFALMGEVQGDAKNRRFVYYDVQAERPSNNLQTKTETTNPAVKTLPVSISPISINGKYVVKGDLELNATNAAVYNAFFSEVIKPDATPTAVSKTVLATLIDFADTLVEESYTVLSWGEFDTAYEAADTINDKVEATQREVNDAVADLQEAILGLVAKP